MKIPLRSAQPDSQGNGVTAQAGRAALITPLCQIGGLIAGIAAGGLVHGLIPGHNLMDVQRVLPAAIVALLGFLGGGLIWGALFARLAGSPERRRAVGAGAIWAVMMITIMVAMQALEPALVLQGGIALHQLYTLMFIPATFLVCFVTALAMAVALRRRERAWPASLRVALLGALVFLFADIGMDLLGWRVGGPQAADRFTMLTVTLVCTLATSAVAGAALLALLCAKNPDATG